MGFDSGRGVMGVAEPLAPRDADAVVNAVPGEWFWVQN